MGDRIAQLIIQPYAPILDSVELGGRQQMFRVFQAEDIDHPKRRRRLGDCYDCYEDGVNLPRFKKAHISEWRRAKLELSSSSSSDDDAAEGTSISEESGPEEDGLVVD